MAKQGGKGGKFGRLSVPKFMLLPERHFRLKICLYRPLMAKQGGKFGRLSVPKFTLYCLWKSVLHQPMLRLTTLTIERLKRQGINSARNYQSNLLRLKIPGAPGIS